SSLHNHWDGLTVFVERPEVAMDNNTAERVLRNPVVGRKNYYGSGSVWSAHLAAILFSVIQTVLLWGLNPHHWLHAFLQACADSDVRAMLTCPTRAEPGSHLTGALCPRIAPSPMMAWCAVANFGNGFDEPLPSFS